MWSQSGKYIIPILATIVAGCTTMGTGTGSTPSGASPTVFSWESSDGVTGTMSATMPGGQPSESQSRGDRNQGTRCGDVSRSRVPAATTATVTL
jgi:hypothetical protein